MSFQCQYRTYICLIALFHCQRLPFLQEHEIFLLQDAHQSQQSSVQALQKLAFRFKMLVIVLIIFHYQPILVLFFFPLVSVAS
jgi:hypothetical protein